MHIHHVDILTWYQNGPTEIAPEKKEKEIRKERKEEVKRWCTTIGYINIRERQYQDLESVRIPFRFNGWRPCYSRTSAEA